MIYVMKNANHKNDVFLNAGITAKLKPARASNEQSLCSTAVRGTLCGTVDAFYRLASVLGL